MVISVGGRFSLTGREVVEVLSTWVVTRLAITALVVVSEAEFLSNGPVADVYAGLWNRFESLWYEDIARNGYVGEGDFRFNTAYFPGTALLMRAGLTLGVAPPITGLIVSFVAGGVAALALGVLARQLGFSGKWTLIAWSVAPTTVFVYAPRSEAVFAALAFWAWALARDGRWLPAGVLAGGAALVRVNGVFLALGLLVLWWTQKPRHGRPLLFLALPFVVTAAYFTYLWSITGRWTEWRDVQEEFWGRETVNPVTAFVNSWDRIFNLVDGQISSGPVMEIVAVVLALVGVFLLARRRWWAECTYVGVTIAALVTSSFYYSIPRTLTLLFPLWIVLGAWLAQTRGRKVTYIVLVLPLTALVILRFVDGQWIS